MAVPDVNETVVEEKNPEKEKRGQKRGKRRFVKFLGILLLLAGTLIGLQASGSFDVRPFIYPLVPKIPLAGKSLAEWMKIPAVYSLSAEQRRKLELEEWEDLIAQRVRSLDVKEKTLSVLSGDLDRREGRLLKSQEEVQKALEALSEDMSDSSGEAGKESEEEMKRLLKTFEEMSPRNAAAIFEKTSDTLAVNLLSRMAEDQVAKILAKMEPGQAARLTEMLSVEKMR